MSNSSGRTHRIPVTETLIAHLPQDELLAYAERHGIDLALDHLNRTAVTVSDAYRIRDIHNAAMAESERTTAEAKAARDELIATWQAKRQEVFDSVYVPAVKGPRWKLGMARGGEHTGALDLAWKAVHKAEDFAVAVGELDPAIRSELGAVVIPPGAPNYEQMVQDATKATEAARNPVRRYWTPDGEVDKETFVALREGR